jgi:hypothetical protein
VKRKYTPEELAAKRARINAEHEKHTDYDNPNQVLTLLQTARLNNVSLSNIRERIEAGELRTVQLSARRLGITVRENQRCQNRRMRKAS